MSKADRFRHLAERQNEESPANKSEIINKIIGVVEQGSSIITEHNSLILNSETETNKGSVENISLSDTNEDYLSEIHTTETESIKVTNNRKSLRKTAIPKPIEEFEKLLSKPTIEQTHTRATWLIRNDLLKRLDKIAKNQHRGFKTHIINYAIERILDEIEGK